MAGQNADMTLKVGLDLNFFRQELQKASSSLAGQPIDVNVRFNKKGIADQYQLLTRYLGGKKPFDVKIESNTLNALTDKVANFQKILKALKDEKVELSINASANIEKFSKEKIRKIRAQIRRDIVSGGAGEIQIPTKLVAPNVTAFVKALAKQAQVTVAIKNGATGKEVRSVLDAIENRIQSDQKIKQGGGKLRVPTSIKASINNADVSDFKKAVNERLGSIAIKIKAEVDIAKTPAQIQAEVARKMEDIARIGAERMAGGGVTEAARREQFRAAITGEGIGSLKNIAGQVGVKGAYKYKSDTATALIDKLVQEASIEAITKYLDPQAVMRNPDRSGLNRVLDTFARGLLQMLGMDPAALKAAKIQTLQSAVQTMQVARSSSGGLPTGVTGLLPSITQRTATSQGVQAIYRSLSGQVGEEGPGGALVDVRRIYAALERNLHKIFEVVEVDVQETSMGIRDAMGAFAYLAQSLRDAEARTKKAQVGEAVKSLLEKVAGALKAAEAQAVIPVSVVDVTRGATSPITGGPQRALPAAGGTTPLGQMRFNAVRTGARQPLTGQSTPFASPLPENYLEIGRIIKGIDPILQRSSVPFSGAIRELGEEFGFAIKQVLLFGTAYKALAFFMDLPAQALQASTALQSFNNQLNAITGGASQAARSMEFINSTVERFNIPLQSAREGFLRLYASMSPAGMDAGMIENLFVGISQTSATLGLSADQVDRVTYAFSQMASKGKVMSEEVTGQLGDVIPGALSLMADAAGMSMADFKQAMEDGLVSGKAMEQLFTNLPIVLEQRFGKGAAGAAQTLQGQLNDLATSTMRLYEAFEPIVNSIAGVVLPALSVGLADAQSAVAAFGMKIEGINPATNLLSENAQNIYRNLEILSDTASTLIGVVQSLGGVFSGLGNVLSGALQLFNAIMGNPVGEFFVKLAVNIGIATAALNLFTSQALINAIAKLTLLIRNIGLAITSFKALTAASRAAKIAVGGIVAGGILVLIETLATNIGKAREETDKLRNSALLAADALKQMSYQQLVAEERSVQDRISKLEQLQAAAGPGLKIKNFSKQQEAMALELGLLISGGAGQRAISLTRAEGLRQQLLEELPRIRGEMKGRFEGPASAATITPIDLSAGEGKAKAEKGRVSFDRLVSAQFAQRAALLKSEAALAREETAAIAPDTMQAERMLKYYMQFREQLIDMATIQAQIEDAEKNRSAYIKDGMSASQLDYNVQQLRNELQVRALDLAAIEQKYRNQARTEAAKEAEEQEKEMQKRIDQQKEMNRLLEDARIQAGLISPAEAAKILQRREFEDAQARFAAIGGDPSQLAAIQAAIPQAGSLQESIKNLRQELEKLASTQEMVKFSANAIGDAFATAFKDAITGAATAQEALAGFFRNLGSAFADMAAQMIQKMITMYILNQALNILPGMGSFFGGAKVGQSVSMPTGAGIGAGAGILQNSMGQGFGTFGPNFGIRQFASGGVVTGPTLGLVGEGRYNEAVVPLPDGKSIPVQLGGGAGGDISTNIVVNVSNGQASSQMSGNGGQALGRELEGAVRQVILKETRPGGLIYSAR